MNRELLEILLWVAMAMAFALLVIIPWSMRKSNGSVDKAIKQAKEGQDLVHRNNELLEGLLKEVREIKHLLEKK